MGSRRATEPRVVGHGLEGSLVKDFDTKDDPWGPVMSSKMASIVPNLHGKIFLGDLLLTPLYVAASPLVRGARARLGREPW